MAHPWHDVELPPQAPKLVLAVIEVPKGSKNKYEIDKQTGMIRVDRVLFSSMQYPANYGFIPRTFCEDRDALDILVLGQEPVYPLSVMKTQPIGAIKMLDQGVADDKIIAVHANDPEYAHYKKIEELPPHRMREVQGFFEQYKTLEDKEVQVEEFVPRDEALQIILESIEAYKKLQTNP